MAGPPSLTLRVTIRVVVVDAVEGASLADASGYDGGRLGLAKRFCYRVR